MTRLPRKLLPLTVLVLAPLLPAAASATTPSYPSVAKVSPLRLGVGDILTVRGTGFRTGKGRNTVVFKRAGGQAIFVRAANASATRLTVAIPPKMLGALAQTAGKPVETRFLLRVLAGRFGRRYTSAAASPRIGPVSSASAGAGPKDDCDGDGIPDAKEADDDNDLLADTLEKTLATGSCNADTDGDGVTDGYEYFSAKDLNGAAVPYPGKQPYPNALDASDGAIDHDGDGLTLTDEYRAWRFSGAKLPLSYSDGQQDTGRVGIVDDRKDVDRDGLQNYVEAHGPLSSSAFWDAYVAGNKCSEKYVESPYPGPKYAGMSFVDADTDGDGIPDGADDIDHDGFDNTVEGQRADGQERVPGWCDSYVSVGTDRYGQPGVSSGHDGTSSPTGPDENARLNPFNPCKPVTSNACHSHPPLGYYVYTKDYTEDWRGTDHRTPAGQ